jgi:hypothetical protein
VILRGLERRAAYFQAFNLFSFVAFDHWIVAAGVDEF